MTIEQWNYRDAVSEEELLTSEFTPYQLQEICGDGIPSNHVEKKHKALMERLKTPLT
jgi:hypothetical protein